MVKHDLTMVIEQWFTIVYDKAWFNDMTMVLLHNDSSMTVQNLTSHLIKLINFFYLKLIWNKWYSCNYHVYTQFRYPIDYMLLMNVIKYKYYR